MKENEYEQIQFSARHESKHTKEENEGTLSKKEESQLLATIKLQDNENLLDLSFQQQTYKNLQYLEFVRDRVAIVQPPITVFDGYVVSYKLYKIKTRKQEHQEYDTAVDRRYSDFQYLHTKLQENYGGCVIPKLPQKNIWASLDMETYEDKTSRKNGLERYLNLILTHQRLRASEELKEFLFDTRNNFSEKKGEFTSQIKVQDKIKKLTSSAYSLGSSLLTKYFYPEKEEKHQINLNRTKEDTEILHYQILIKDLIQISNQFKVIVMSTVNEIDSLHKISQICGEPIPQTKEIDSQHLLSEYENFCNFVQSCEAALQRRQKLREQLEYLKIQEQKLEIKNKNNPRSIELDIIHSEIKKKSAKCVRWTKDLLAELQPQINYGKSLITKYIDELSLAKCTLYNQ